MQQRIIELAAQSPCSVEYLADVLQQPKEAIAAEQKNLERQGRLKAKTLVLYRAEARATATEKQLERRISRQLNHIAEAKGIAAWAPMPKSPPKSAIRPTCAKAALTVKSQRFI